MTTTAPSPNSPSPGPTKSMRWPIYLQLLLPMVSVVLLASALATAVTAYWIAGRIRSEQAESLQRVARTLAKAPFPLTDWVLEQMSGLSGADFVLIGMDRHVQETTLPLEPAWTTALAQLAPSRLADATDAQQVISLGSRDYLVDCVAISPRAYLPEPATLFILYPEDRLAARIHQAVYPALTAGGLAMVVAMAITTWLARRFIRPIRTLVAQTATIAHGDFAPLPVPPRNDELRDLAQSINHMAGQLIDYEQQVRHSERLKTLGQLGAAMAHQLRNAATGGRMAIELHQQECPLLAQDESLEVALRQLRLMDTYLRQFLSVNRPLPPPRKPVDTSALVAEVLGLIRPTCTHCGIALEHIPLAEPLVLHGDEEGLRQLVTNLVLNAIDAARVGTTLPRRVGVELRRREDGCGELNVEDTGCGPAAAVADTLFDSFVTTKPDGVGLGLFVARQIAQQHGGRLSWSRRGERTRFVFEFPCQDKGTDGARTDR